jgi:hypothetical protein
MPAPPAVRFDPERRSYLGFVAIGFQYEREADAFGAHASMLRAGLVGRTSDGLSRRDLDAWAVGMIGLDEDSTIRKS